MRFQRSVLALIVLILIAAAINLPLATIFLKSRTDNQGETVINVIGPEAAAYDWPTDTPHAHEWPPPTQWSKSRDFGYRNIGVWSSRNGRTSHQMEYELIGWPLPVYQRVQMWWPWDDPKWQTAAQSDPAMALCWPGVLLNPLILGGGVWLVLIFPFSVWMKVRRGLRKRRGRCPICGYDLRGHGYQHAPRGVSDHPLHSESGGTLTGCPECGWNRIE